MSLKILLADDNLTAQRMGSKILTDAGYEVIAVSNGAAAIKKIASDKPGLLILDVYMPGYTGLEVCEKIKNDPVTAQLPIILTVTNMEPFDRKEGDRVRADGLMIKPFEASDLIAVVQKFESKFAKPAPPPAPYPDTQKIEEFKDASYEEWKAAATEEPESKKIEMPAEIAAAPALGFDDAIGEPSVAPPAIEEPALAPPAPETLPSFGVEAPVGYVPGGATVEFEPSPTALDLSPSAEALPSLDAAAALVPPAEFEATSAQLVGEIAVNQAAELEVQTSAAEEFVAQDPALVTNPDEMAQFTTTVGADHPEEIPVGIAMPGLTAEEVPMTDQAGAEVAPTTEEASPPVDPANITTMKMPAYQEAPVVAQSMVSSILARWGAGEIEPLAQSPAPAIEEPNKAFSEMYTEGAVTTGSAAAAAPAPVHESSAETESTAVAEPEAVTEPQVEHPAAPPPPIPDDLVQQFAAELDQAHEEREAREHAEEQLVSEAHVDGGPVTESVLAQEVPASQLDEERIAAAVNRALEKYKDGLRAELIATIIRELKG